MVQKKLFSELNNYPATKAALKNNLGITNLEEKNITGIEVVDTYANEGSGTFLPTTGTVGTSYKVANDPDSSKNGYYHWSGSGYVKDDEIGINEDDFRLKNANVNYDRKSEVLTPTLNSRRLSIDGTSVSFAGWTTSRYLKVNFGDLIVYTGSHPTTRAGVVGYSEKNEATFTEHISVGKGADLTLQTYYAHVSNNNTRYIRACTQNGSSNEFLDEFSIKIIPAKGDIKRQVELGTLRNLFPNALSKAPVFASKFLGGQDVNILCLGDSITQFSNQTANDNPEQLPPFMERKNWVWNLWNYINHKSDIIHRRSDYPGFFTTSGTFTTPSGTDNSYNYVYSTDSAAYFTFDWDLTEWEKTNLIMSKNGVQSNDIRVQVLVSGIPTSGKVEFFNGATWEEANNKVLSLRLAGTEGEIIACDNNRYKLRVASAATGSVTIKVFKNTPDSDRIQFWGVEQWNGQGIFVSNAAKGGYATYELRDGMYSNVRDRYPDLVLFQMTLTNNYDDRYADATAKDDLVNDFHDFIWGDRLGFEDALSLKNLSNNWTDFEVVLIFPHWRKEFVTKSLFNTTINFGTPIAATLTAMEAWNVVKSLVMSKNDLAYINIASTLKQEALQRGWDLEQSYDGDTGSDMTSEKCFTQDTVHLNDLGSELYGKYIAPIFDF